MPKPGFQPSGRPTLGDIAARAETSISTVSVVLANKAKQRRLSDDVVERVRKAAAELDYAPNLLVRSLQRGRTHTLMFYNAFRKRVEQDLYMDRLSLAIELAGGRHRLDILVNCVFDRTAEETYRHINGGRCDGLLVFAPQQDDPLLPFLRNSRLPCVLINSIDSEGVLSYVKEDYMDGVRQVADLLSTLGHRRIAALGTIPGGNPDAEARTWMFKQFLGARGIPMPDRWIVASDETEAATEETLRFLMSEPNPPTAIFCWHDRLGYRILDQCEKLGIAVPDQLSLIGYDGIRWPAASRHVLASVTVSANEIAEAAVALLQQLINGEATAPVGKVLAVTIDHGTTLGPPPA
jgi:DNA-binding LacI/PurR family transcriptional regulator